MVTRCHLLNWSWIFQTAFCYPPSDHNKRKSYLQLLFFRIGEVVKRRHISDSYWSQSSNKRAFHFCRRIFQNLMQFHMPLNLDSNKFPFYKPPSWSLEIKHGSFAKGALKSLYQTVSAPGCRSETSEPSCNGLISLFPFPVLFEFPSVSSNEHLMRHTKRMRERCRHHIFCQNSP